MAKFKNYDVAGMLGITPVIRITDAEVWSTLLTPCVRSLLGEITAVGEPQVIETTKGLFPGDEVTNFNDHRLYGGQTGYIRYPYISRMIRTTLGALVIKRDGLKLKAFGWYGDVEKGRAELIYKVALRDRRYDGGKRANECSLIDWPQDHPTLHKPLPIGDARSVELSIYGFLPGSRVFDATGEKEFEDFVASPYSFLDRPEKFLHYFQRAWNSRCGPGQVGAPIPDVSQLMSERFEQVSKRVGYDFLENAPSHYHVAMWCLSKGYKFSYERDVRTMNALAAGIKRLKESGMALTRPQESWVCVAQSLPAEHIPSKLNLGGPVWPQNNLDNQVLWMYKPLSERAPEMFKGPIAE